MWKALFLAIGISMIIIGIEGLMVDTVVLAARGDAKTTTFATPSPANRQIKPAEWLPWGLMSGGIIVIIYSHTVPKLVSD